MKKQTTVRGMAAAAAVLSLALAGCGSDGKSESTSSAEESTSTTSAEATETSAATSSAAAAPAGENYTIAEYIKDNGITEAQIRRGADGAPTVNLPTPPVWIDAEVEHLHQVGVIEPRVGARLRRKALQQRGIATELRQHPLDGDLLLEARLARLLAAIDQGHAALA